MDDIKNKIIAEKIEINKEIYIYGLNKLKSGIWIFAGLNLMVLGAVFGYDAFINHDTGFTMAVAAAAFIFGALAVSMKNDYKISIDTKNRKIIHKRADIALDEIETAKVMIYKPKGTNKKIKVLEIITKERVQMLVPLIMDKKIHFLALLRKILDDKFIID